MAYYTNLINAWNGATQPPAGVTGTALNGGMSTAQKLAAVNAWTVTGSVPTVLSLPGASLLNAMAYSEFKTLTAAQQQNLLLLCCVPGLLLGGSAETAQMADGMILDYFTGKPLTIAALTALATASVQPWWQTNGYPRAFDLGDVSTAGLS